MVDHRKLPFDRVVANLKKGGYRGKICQADYSNLGMGLFDLYKFRDQLDVSEDFLRNIGLVYDVDQVGWVLPRQPTVEELLAKREIIEEERQKNEAATRQLQAKYRTQMRKLRSVA
jgi:hypothetical protein